MNRISLGPLVLILIIFLASDVRAQSKRSRRLFDQKNLIAWCIVPFDSKNRTPEQRVEMLKRLNFSQYAYDWRPQHLDSFAAEIELARNQDVAMSAVWIWIDRNSDNPGQLSADNERMLNILRDSGHKAQLWVGFNHNYFHDMAEAERIDAGVKMIQYLRKRTEGFVTTVGLYNHGDWFGDAFNQVKMVKKVNDPKVGIVFNFHHAHLQVEDFRSRVEAMKPYLLAVNINGMEKSGSQILPVGSGSDEKGMLSTLLDTGYTGPIGVLGHIETEDVEVVLKRNLEGLRRIAAGL